MNKFLLSALAAILVLLAAGCSTIPETGRRQLLLVDQATETQMGLEAFADVKRETPISTDKSQQQRIERIGRRIAESVGRALPDAQWEFVVFNDDKTVNAFALPGGKVGVYTGLIKLASRDDELAVVIGHEIAHVTSHHSGERMSQAMVAQGLSVGATALAEKSAYKDLASAAAAGTANVVLLYYSRDQESEADAIGLRFAAGAGYDPRAAVEFWKKMQAKSQGKEPFKWLSTHPPSAERIARLQELAPTFMSTYETAKKRYEQQ